MKDNPSPQNRHRYVGDKATHDSALIHHSKELYTAKLKRKSRIGRTWVQILQSLGSHKRAWQIAHKARTAYGKVFGWAHVLPNAYIIGFAKCGTTSLYSYLLQHEEVFSASKEELNYFSWYDRYCLGHNWYRSNFPLTVQKIVFEIFNRKKFVTIDKSPDYIINPHALTRIKQATPNAKFIVMVRNPIDRAYSQYNHKLSPSKYSPAENRTFEEAIEHEVGGGEAHMREWKRMRACTVIDL